MRVSSESRSGLSLRAGLGARKEKRQGVFEFIRIRWSTAQVYTLEREALVKCCQLFPLDARLVRKAYVRVAVAAGLKSREGPARDPQLSLRDAGASCGSTVTNSNKF